MRASSTLPGLAVFRHGLPGGYSQDVFQGLWSHCLGLPVGKGQGPGDSRLTSESFALAVCVLRCCVASQQRDRSHSATGQTGATPFSGPGLTSEE